MHLNKRGEPVADHHFPLKIAFVIKAMSNPGGGAERVLASVCSGLAERGHNVTIITSDPSDQPSFYPLSSRVRRVSLGVGTVEGNSRPWDVVRRIWVLRRKILNCAPNVVVAFMHSSYLPVGMALVGTGIPMVASEHIGPDHYQTRPFQLALVMLTPFMAQKITVVSEQIKQQYGPWLRRVMVVAPNPIAAPSTKNEKRAPRARRVLSVGRLTTQKNHGCLIAAFALIASDFPDWTLRIVGEGELRGALERQIREFGLERRVELPGAISDIWREYRNASFFVSPSTYESFGLATAEALLSGVPAVAFEDCPGTNVLIQNNVDGILVNESRDRTQALSIVLKRLMASPEEVERLSHASVRRLEAYSLPRVLDTWESILRDAAQATTSTQFDRVKIS
ncbi:glycosyltransferase family 4 protein [Methylocystis sp. H62]|uniref:glycosyltransferase family 4 protein n=1 Tax=Methylocystis sp. H62 TaxID=2785789 RepID=UPI0018C1CF9A|nr:glycosyltransferase family 4 protein [Methylocystis sp. H62]MBG0792644.1 glycosyltransferase family 4 protein [Methylocystis sp. H62]